MRKYSEWKRECSLSDHPELSWLWFRITGRKFRTMCLICHTTVIGKGENQFRGCIRLHHFKRHQNTSLHQETVARFLGRKLRRNIEHAPSAELFRQTLEHFKNGNSPTQGYNLPAGIVDKVKADRMLWMLYEADVHLKREHIRRSDVMVISRDERHSRCSIHYRSMDDDLVMEAGFLGQKRGAPGDALSIISSTEEVLRRFCTCFAHPPRGAAVAPVFLEEVYDHACSIIEATTTDSASNEILATTDSSKSRSSSMPAVFKKQQFILRDGARGARRLLTRLYAADPVLDGIFGLFVHWNHSPGNLVQHSKDLAVMFRECCEACISEAAVSTTFQNMRSAMHRFETHTTPLSRCALNPSAVLAFMVKVSVARTGKIAATPVRFLSIVSGSVESWVLAGMLSDGGVEVLAFIRLLDSDDVSTAALCEHIASFLQRIEWLFGEGGIMHLSFSHTAFIMRWLETPHFLIVSGRSMTVGGNRPEPSLISKCLGHMQAWLRLARVTLNAEFPNFTVLNAFSAFCLPSRRSAAASAFTDEVKRKLARLAQVFKQPLLCQQFEDIIPSALTVYHDSGAQMSYWDAWVIATKKRDAQRSLKTESNAVKFIIQRGCTYAPVTACVEHGFSKTSALLNIQSLSCEEPTENRNVSLTLLQAHSAKLDLIIDCARRMYTEAFPFVSRLCVRPRKSRGIKKLRTAPRKISTGVDVTETDFKLRLRTELQQKVGSRVPAVAATPIWTDKHESEETFQVEKIMRRFVEANMTNQLLPDEVSENLQVATLQEQLRQQKSLRQRQNSGLKRFQQFREQPLTSKDFHRARIMLDDDVPLGSCDLSRHQALDVRDPWLATVFVAQKPWEPKNSHLSWDAALLGAWITSPAALRSESAPSLKLSPALRTRRHIWMSAGFSDEYPHLARLIAECAAQSGFKAWKFLESSASFATLRSRKKDVEVVALVSTTERAANSLAYVFGKDEFLSFITRLDLDRTSVGWGCDA